MGKHPNFLPFLIFTKRHLLFHSGCVTKFNWLFNLSLCHYMLLWIFDLLKLFLSVHLITNWREVGNGEGKNEERKEEKKQLLLYRFCSVRKPGFFAGALAKLARGKIHLGDARAQKRPPKSATLLRSDWKSNTLFIRLSSWCISITALSRL